MHCKLKQLIKITNIIGYNNYKDPSHNKLALTRDGHKTSIYKREGQPFLILSEMRCKLSVAKLHANNHERIRLDEREISYEAMIADVAEI